MDNRKKNIAWYSRAGHLDMFCRLDENLNQSTNIHESFFVCHTKAEERKIEANYGIKPTVIGDYFYKKKADNYSRKRIEELEDKYDFIALKSFSWLIKLLSDSNVILFIIVSETIR